MPVISGLKRAATKGSGGSSAFFNNSRAVPHESTALLAPRGYPTPVIRPAPDPFISAEGAVNKMKPSPLFLSLFVAGILSAQTAPASHARGGDHMMKRLTAELNLTPDQQSQAHAIFK